MTEYSEHVKAQVMAALMAEGPSAVAARFNIPLGTVKRWNADRQVIMRPVEGEVLERSDPERSAKKARIASLIIQHMESNLETLIHLSEWARSNDEWLCKQSASDVAILFGVVSDKTHRLLEAMVTTEGG